MENLPKVQPNSKKSDFNEDEYRFIRGFPRPRKNVEFVEQMMGGKLIEDREASLIARLDHYLFEARQKLGKFPDLIQLPEEPFAWFCPVPFDVNFFGTVLKSYRKPAWFRVNRPISVPWGKK